METLGWLCPRGEGVADALVWSIKCTTGPYLAIKSLIHGKKTRIMTIIGGGAIKF